MDAQSDKTGMESHAFLASVEGNGMLLQGNVSALQVTGMAFHAFNALQDKHGMLPAFLAHVYRELSGTV